MTQTMPGFDHLDPELPGRLYQTYQQLRDECPVAHGENFGGFWVLSRHEDIVAAVRNHEVFSNAHGVTLPNIGCPVPAIPTESDPPRHTDYRGVLMPFLLAKKVLEREPYVRGVVTDLIDEVIEAGHCDAVTSFAQVIPGLVVGDFFGFPEGDALKCLVWMAAMFEAGGRGDLAAQEEASKAVIGYLQGQIDERRASPRENDVVTAMIQAQPKTGTFSDEEILGILFTSVIGAVETTVNTMGHMIHYVGTVPDVRAQLLAERGLAMKAVDEALRIEAPAQQAMVTVVKPITVHGQEMRPGDKVLLLWGSANRDERVFEDPESFRLDRRINPHMSFSHGIHKCAGQHLARLELRVLLEEMLARMPDYQVGEVTGPSLTGGISWHLDSLPITFTPGPRVGTTTVND